MKRVWLAVACVCGGALSATAVFGCGDGERMKTGTQVEVSDTLVREAEASSKFLDEQAKAGGTAAKKNIDAVEPGRP